MTKFEKIIVGLLFIETGIVGFFIYALLKMVDVCLIN